MSKSDSTLDDLLRTFVIWRYHRHPWFWQEPRRLVQIVDDFDTAQRYCKLLSWIDPDGYFSVVVYDEHGVER